MRPELRVFDRTGKWREHVEGACTAQVWLGVEMLGTVEVDWLAGLAVAELLRQRMVDAIDRERRAGQDEAPRLGLPRHRQALKATRQSRRNAR